MQTLLEEKQLNEELQELYTIASHWVADLDFLHNDLRFLTGMYIKEDVKNLTDVEKTEILRNINQLDRTQLDIRTKVTGYLQQLKPLIIMSGGEYQLSLIETHAFLEREIEGLLANVKPLKQLILKRISA